MRHRHPIRPRSFPLFCALYYPGCAAIVWGGFRAAAGARFAPLLIGGGVVLWIAAFLVAPLAPKFDDHETPGERADSDAP